MRRSLLCALPRTVWCWGALFALCSLAGTCHKRIELDDYILMVVDDFEISNASRWHHDDHVLYSQLEYVTDARVGRQAGRVKMAGDPGMHRWTDMYRKIDRWPEGGEAVTFWARATEPIDLYVKLNEKIIESDMEIWGAKVRLTPEWKHYWVPLGSFTNRLAGNPRGNKQLDLFAVYGVGFAECLPYLPIEFWVDQIQIERSRAE